MPWMPVSSSKTLQQNKTPDGAIMLEQRLCVSGGLAAAWSVVPCESIKGVACVRITTYGSPWLYDICFGCKTPTSTSSAVVQWSIDYCRELVRSITTQADVVTEDVPDDAAAILGLSSDSDAEHDSQTSTATQSPRKRHVITTWSAVNSIHGRIQLKCAAKGNVIWVRSARRVTWVI